MNLRNCSKCGKLFQYAGTGRKLCPACLQAEEKEFDQIRTYLDKHPGATAEEVAHNTGIPVDRILDYLREGRLIVAPGSAPLLKCQSCGAAIHTGRLCSACAAKLSHKFGAAASGLGGKGPATDPTGKGGMHIYPSQQENRGKR